MGSFIEIDLDLDYLDDLEQITVHDETGLHDDAEFYLGGLLAKDNDKLRELLQRLLTEYRYMRVRPRRVYLQHEARMRAIEEEMRELGIEVDK